MNPFDEQLKLLQDEFNAAEDKLKIRKLYTWYDIEKYEDCISKLTNEITDLKTKETGVSDSEGWGILAVGFALGMVLTAIFLHITN
jgi:hypothetical protein